MPAVLLEFSRPCPASYATLAREQERLVRSFCDRRAIERAQRATGQGITETVRQGLRLVAAGDTLRRVANLRGTVKFSVDLTRLRDDRR